MNKSPFVVDKFASQMYQNGIPSEKWHDAFEEKLLIKKLSNIFGVSLIVQVVSSLIISGVILIFINILKHFAHLYFPDIYNNNKPLTENVLNLYMYIIYMFTAFAVMAFMLKKNPLKAINARRIEKPVLILPTIIVSMLFYTLGIFLTSLIQSYLSVIHLKTEVPDFAMPTQPAAIVFYILMICVFAPLLEEFIFRGLILQSLRKFGDVFAIVISAMLFGLMHGNLLQAPFAFIAALAFGYFVIKLNSIWVSVIAHCFINTSSVAMDLIQKAFGANTADTVSKIAFAAILILSALCMLILKQTGYFDKNKLADTSILPFGIKFRALILAPGFLVFAAAVLTEIIITTRII
jgi:membrane protease YdiL (CAAX protease family)